MGVRVGLGDTGGGGGPGAGGWEARGMCRFLVSKVCTGVCISECLPGFVLITSALLQAPSYTNRTTIPPPGRRAARGNSRVDSRGKTGARGRTGTLHQREKNIFDRVQLHFFFSP